MKGLDQKIFVGHVTYKSNEQKSVIDESKKILITNKTSYIVYAEGNLLNRQCEPCFVFSSVGIGTKIHDSNVVSGKEIISSFQLNSVTVFPFKKVHFFAPLLLIFFVGMLFQLCLINRSRSFSAGSRAASLVCSLQCLAVSCDQTGMYQLVMTL